MKSLIIVFLSVITIILSVILGFFGFTKETMEYVYINWIYYILLANILLSLFAIIRAENNIYDGIKEFFKKNVIAVVIAAIITVIGCFAAKPDFKILADETNLLSMSQALYEEKECKNYTSVLYFYYGFKNIISYVNDKRPALFPFTVSIVHSLTGYRPSNIFVVNLFSGFLCLLLLYHLIGLKYGRYWGICGMLMLSAFPLFVIYMTSGGFEIFNLMFSLFIILYLIKFIKSPSAVSAEALLLLLPLFGQTRYESVLAVFSVIPIIFIFLPKNEYYKFSYKLPLIPLFFIPIVWLRLITDNAHAWQVADLNESFSIEWFFKNLRQSVVFFFSGNRDYCVIPLVSILAVIGFIFTISQKRKSKNSIWLACSLVVFYFLHAAARFSYSMCDFTTIAGSRLALIFLPIIVFLAISFLEKTQKWFHIRKLYYVLCLGFLMVFYWPSCGLSIGVRNLTLQREFKTSREYLETNFPNKNEYILVADRANMYVPLKYSTIGFAYLRNNKKKVIENLKNRTYRYMIMIQLINKNNNMPLENCKVPESFKLETLYELQTRADRYIRISKCEINNL